MMWGRPLPARPPACPPACFACVRFGFRFFLGSSSRAGDHSVCMCAWAGIAQSVLLQGSSLCPHTYDPLPSGHARRRGLLVVLRDISMAARVERALADLTESQLAVVASILPKHGETGGGVGCEAGTVVCIASCNFHTETSWRWGRPSCPRWHGEGGLRSEAGSPRVQLPRASEINSSVLAKAGPILACHMHVHSCRLAADVVLTSPPPGGPHLPAQ